MVTTTSIPQSVSITLKSPSLSISTVHKSQESRHHLVKSHLCSPSNASHVRTHACTYAQMYFLFNNQECALLASILLCVCVCFRDWYESLKSTFPKMYSQEILVHIPSVIALMPQVLEAGRVVESLVQLEHWVWAVHILDHCSSSPKPPRQYLL